MCLKIQECLKAISKQNGDRICEDRGWLGKASWLGWAFSQPRKEETGYGEGQEAFSVGV